MKKMDIKKLLVSFVAIISVLLLVSTVSAAIDFTVNEFDEVTIDGVEIYPTTNEPAIIAGETVTVKVIFTPAGTDPNVTETASNIRVKAEIEGDKGDVEIVSKPFDVEENNTYVKVLSLKVPYELKDETSDEATLNLKIWGGDTTPYTKSFDIKIQRPSYNAGITITTSNIVNAGETLPVDIVVKNIGYNDLDDLFVTAKISALDVEESSFFGDLVAIEDDDDEDTVKVRVYLKVPYDVEEGKYALEVEVSNDDLVLSKVKEISIKNEFPETILKTDEGLFFINPTNVLKIYRVILPSGEENVVSVQSGSTNTFEVTPTSDNYVVTVLKMTGEVVNSFTFALKEKAAVSFGTPIVALTVILAIIFLVLLIVLIVLVTKKPEKAEELGESYY